MGPACRPAPDEGGTIRREAVVLLVLAALTVACGAAAAVLGRQVWAAALGAALVVAYWLVELLASRLGARGSFANGLAVGLAGMVARLALVLGTLGAVGLIARQAFPEAVLSFLLAYSIYQVLRLVAHPALATHPGRE